MIAASWPYLAAFLTVTVLDILFALYVRAASAGKVWAAPVYAGILYGVHAGMVVWIVINNWLIIPACIGAFVGTAIGMRIKV